MQEDLIKHFYTEHSHKRIKILGKEREYIVSGTGKVAFLLLPGGGQTAQLNFKLTKELDSKYKVISPTIYDYDSVDEFNLVTNEIIQKEEVSSLVMYGLSIGGLLAQSYLLRNQDKVRAIIISHACTPKSKTYYKKVIRPLKLLNTFLPIIPNIGIKQFTKRFHKIIQGGSNNTKKILFTTEEKIINDFFRREFYSKYLDKRLLKTWINLHLDFYKNEHFDEKSFKNWNGEILILRTDNDPLMQDEGAFKKIYPKAQVVTFKDTGHLTFYYQFEEMVKVIKDFLK